MLIRHYGGLEAGNVREGSGRPVHYGAVEAMMLWAAVLGDSWRDPESEKVNQ